jgi:hypothetical protein
VDQKIRDTDYAKTTSHQWCDAHGQWRAPLDLTEPRLETELASADNVMAAETECYYRRHDKATGERERRRDDHLLQEVHIHRDPQATFRRFLDGPCACLLSSQGKTALRGCFIFQKEHPPASFPPCTFYSRVLGVVSAKGSQKYPQATPTKIMPGIQH